VPQQAGCSRRLVAARDPRRQTLTMTMRRILTTLAVSVLLVVSAFARAGVEAWVEDVNGTNYVGGRFVGSWGRPGIPSLWRCLRCGFRGMLLSPALYFCLSMT